MTVVFDFRTPGADFTGSFPERTEMSSSIGGKESLNLRRTGKITWDDECRMKGFTLPESLRLEEGP